MIQLFSVNFLPRVWWLGVGLSLVGIITLSQAENTTTTTTDPNQILSDYTEHKSQFFNYDVYKDLSGSSISDQNATEFKSLVTAKLSTTKNSSQAHNKLTTHNESSQDASEVSTSQHAIDLEVPIMMFKKLYSSLYMGFGQMSDLANQVYYKEVIFGIKNYKFLWINHNQTLGFYTGLDLNFELGYRKAGGNYIDDYSKTINSIQLINSVPHDKNHPINRRQIFDPMLYHNYDTYGFNTGLVLVTGLKINFFKQFSVLTEVGAGINYNLFTIPQKNFYKQISDSFKYSVVGGQLQAYLGVDYNSVIELGVIFANSSSGFSSISGLITFTF